MFEIHLRYHITQTAFCRKEISLMEANPTLIHDLQKKVQSLRASLLDDAEGYLKSNILSALTSYQLAMRIPSGLCRDFWSSVSSLYPPRPIFKVMRDDTHLTQKICDDLLQKFGFSDRAYHSLKPNEMLISLGKPPYTGIAAELNQKAIETATWELQMVSEDATNLTAYLMEQLKNNYVLPCFPANAFMVPLQSLSLFCRATPMSRGRVLLCILIEHDFQELGFVSCRLDDNLNAAVFTLLD